MRLTCVPIVVAALTVQAIGQPVPASRPAAMDVGNRRQVFVDRAFLAAARDVELRVHPPRKTGEAAVRPNGPGNRASARTVASCTSTASTACGTTP